MISLPRRLLLIGDPSHEEQTTLSRDPEYGDVELQLMALDGEIGILEERWDGLTESLDDDELSREERRNIGHSREMLAGTIRRKRVVRDELSTKLNAIRATLLSSPVPSTEFDRSGIALERFVKETIQ